MTCSDYELMRSIRNSYLVRKPVPGPPVKGLLWHNAWLSLRCLEVVRITWSLLILPVTRDEAKVVSHRTVSGISVNIWVGWNEHYGRSSSLILKSDMLFNPRPSVCDFLERLMYRGACSTLSRSASDGVRASQKTSVLPVMRGSQQYPT